MQNQETKITIISPTTGKKSLYKLIESLDAQNVNFNHIILWDDKRDDDFLYPNPTTLKVRDPYELNSSVNGNIRYSIVIPGTFVQFPAVGSSLRSVALMSVNTPFVTFADTDVFFEPNHLESLLKLVEGHEWAYCRRKMWTDKGDTIEYLGVDNFESVGDSPDRKVPYEMVDNNCMIFKRRYGTSAAVIYRETRDAGDDRLMYAFLKQYAGVPGITKEATINHICPERLEPMFRENCTK
jgi:hypothetical protein